uniref:GPI ethanolamine phosphate transferase 2 n=1 Tax=Panagrellus redivivus TaxID=6233 RepID=A0A7E4W506_PANRE
MANLLQLVPAVFLFTGFYLFLVGFFPPKIAIRPEVVTKPFCDPVQDAPLVGKFVFVVIDGWRSDFLFDEHMRPESAAMPFLTETLKSQTIPATALLCHVQHPTVTMPRLKAILSGIVPSYLDVVTNLASTRLAEDNWLSQAAKQEKRTIFFGDDTWMKLFPAESKVLLPESEGTVSFFVTDYTEVDDNVTRHLPRWTSTSRDWDWDIMVLHYLGLDHIGHSVGDKSPKIDVKLKEMDGIIEKIYKNLSTSSTDAFSIIILGDHGMADEGGHGGSTYKESHVPVVVLFGPESEEPFPHPSFKISKIEQVDLAPTISFILNQEIPFNNIGVTFIDKLALPAGLDGRRLSLDALMKNGNQLKPLVDNVRERLDFEVIEDFELCLIQLGQRSCSKSTDEDEELTHEMEVGCRRVFQDVQKELLQLSSDYNYGYILLGLALTLIACGLSVLWAFDVGPIRRQPELLIIVFQPFIAFASSFVEEEKLLWYFLLPTFAVSSFYRRAWAGFDAMIMHRVLVNLKPVLVEFFNSEFALAFRFDLLSLIPAATVLWRLVEGPYLFRVWVCMKLLSDPFDLPDTVFSLNGFLYADYFVSLFFLLTNEFQIGILVWVMSLASPANRVILFLIYLLGHCYQKRALTLHPLVIYVGCVTSFYYTGNSHSLATMDLSAAYSRMWSYHPAGVGVQLFLITYSGPIVFLMSVFRRRAVPSHFIRYLQMARFTSLFVSLVALFFFRHHLFVWSVFAPKIVYDFFHTVPTTLIVLLHSVLPRLRFL